MDLDIDYLLSTSDPMAIDALFAEARRLRDSIYGPRVFMRGLIEISNHCKNNCLYCGIRRDRKSDPDNADPSHRMLRYRLSVEQIIDCCNEGYDLGFRSFVLQGGEDGWFTDDVMCHVVGTIKSLHPDCSVTLSLGERGRESFSRLKDAGADRYLLRHETADPAHYAFLHPSEMSFANRMQSLRDLREVGFQVGAGFMVGSPGQTIETMKKDLSFIATFRPEMVGIGPFIPASGTPFEHHRAGSVELTVRLLAIIRLLHPHVLLPATSALGTLHPKGREMALNAGANVVMPNLSPSDTRAMYCIYNNKLSTGSEAAESAADIRARIKNLGLDVPSDRGDYI